MRKLTRKLTEVYATMDVLGRANLLLSTEAVIGRGGHASERRSTSRGKLLDAASQFMFQSTLIGNKCGCVVEMNRLGRP
jgi:hypothetical protein